MKELHIYELVEVSGGKFHIFAQDGGNPSKKDTYAGGEIDASYSPNNGEVEFSISRKFGYQQGFGVNFSKPTFGIGFNKKMVRLFILSFMALLNLCSLSACNSYFTENINPYPLGTPSKVANPNCANSHIREHNSKNYDSAEYRAWLEHMRDCK